MMNHQINIGFETEVADENSVRELIRTCAERVLTSEQVDFDAEIDVTVVDADGGQVADFFAEVKGTHEEYLSLFVTIDCNESLRIGVGSILYSNLYHAMFEVIQDDV